MQSTKTCLQSKGTSFLIAYDMPLSTTLFIKETGLSPAKFLEKSRLEAAVVAMEQRSLPLKTVAKRCGFSNINHFRRAYQRQYGVPPQGFRARFC